MKVVYSWLKEVVDINVPTEELAEALTGAGLEVASIQHLRVPAKVKVARVLEVARHPNADRLSLCKVDAGGAQPLAIVCGAPNVVAGMLAPLAVEGAILGPEFTVKKTKIRGVESFGMLCSEQELGISEDHSGIMSLPSHYVVGDELSVYFPEDAVIEVEITPSRGDCLSVIGVAREVAARYGLQIKPSARMPQEQASDPIASAISVTIEAPDACPRYAGRLIRGVTIRPSPDWVQRRLSLAGLRPINNVVDVTNLMMLHYGQPMHSFDYNQIRGASIVVRKAGQTKSFVTLDGSSRSLIAADLLICDAERPVALAGIMGGAGSEISDATSEVFLECAFFSQTGIRKTSKRLGLSTDASYRFERGVDPAGGLIDALDTAAELIAEFGGGKTAAGRIDVHPQPVEPRTIKLRPSRVKKILGHSFSDEKITGFLTSIGLSCEQREPDAMYCTAPPFRHDLIAEEDLIEEVGRLHGYNAIPASEYAAITLGQQPSGPEQIADMVRHALAFCGFNEIVTNSMVSEKKRIVLTPGKQPVTVINPLNPDMAEMRTTLAGSMLEVVAYNLNRKNQANKFFELGKTYETLASGDRREADVLGIIIEGNWTDASWNAAAVPCDFFLVKGVLESFAAHAGAGCMSMAPLQPASNLFEREAALVSMGNLIKGTVGMIAPRVLDHFNIKSRVYFTELEVSDFLQAPPPFRTFKPLPRFPAIERDFCFVMPEKVSAGAISEEIFRISPLVEDVRPFDLYRGEKLGNDRKSIAYSVFLRSSERTLTDKEAEAVGASILEAVAKKFGATLRT